MVARNKKNRFSASLGLTRGDGYASHCWEGQSRLKVPRLSSGVSATHNEKLLRLGRNIHINILFLCNSSFIVELPDFRRGFLTCTGHHGLKK